jgi:hypothetical protein
LILHTIKNSMKNKQLYEIIKVEFNIAKKNLWFNNHWCKSVNLIAVDILEEIKDSSDRTFQDKNFLKDSEIQPYIVKADRRIAKLFPEWNNRKTERTKLFKDTLWDKKHIEQIIVLNDKIFANTTQEGNIIWDEIRKDMVVQIWGVTQNPVLWTIKNRYWINSKFAAQKIGLKLNYLGVQGN